MYGPGSASARKTILIVASDPVFRTVLKDWLAAKGRYSVVATSSMASVLDGVPLCAPDLLVYVGDMAGPGKDDLTSVRGYAPYAMLPIVVVGDDGSDGAPGGPLTTFLPYPFHVDSLTMCVAEMLTRSDIRAWTSAAAS